MVKSSIRTANKKVLNAINSSDDKNDENLKELYKKFVKTIDTAVSKKIVKKKTAARKKSRLGKQVHSSIQNIDNSSE